MSASSLLFLIFFKPGGGEGGVKTENSSAQLHFICLRSPLRVKINQGVNKLGVNKQEGKN